MSDKVLPETRVEDLRDMCGDSPISQSRSQPVNIEGNSRAGSLNEARSWLLFHACEQPPLTLRPVWETSGIIGDALAPPALAPLGLTWPPLPPVPPRDTIPFVERIDTSLQSSKAKSSCETQRAGRIPIKRGRGTPAEAAEDRDRIEALATWQDLLLPLSSALPKQPTFEFVDFAFANKSTGTLHARSVSARQFLRWAASHGYIPALTVDLAEEYVSSLLREKETAPRAAAFRELVGFLKGTVQLKTADEILASVVVRGCAVKGERARKTRGARREFLIEELIKLEDAVLPGERALPVSDESRVFIGFVLFCVYARVRFSDAAKVQTEPFLDLHEGNGFVETSTKGARTKTGQSVKRARRTVPLVGPARGFAEGSWAEAWLRLRAVNSLQAERDGALMLAPRVEEGVGVRKDCQLETHSPGLSR